MTPMWFVILSLFVYRVVRLWLVDVIAEPVRSKVVGNDQRVGWLLRRPNRFKLWLVDLLTCSWCLGVWVGLGAVAVLGACGMEPYDWSPLGVALGVATGLALAAAQSFLHLAEAVIEVVIDRLDD